MDREIDRLAPLGVLAGAAALFVSLFLRYYEVPHGGSTFTGWQSFSTADILLVIAAGAAALAVGLAVATRVRWPYLGAAMAGALATAVLVYVASRPPAASLVNKATGGGAHGAAQLVLAYGAFVGLAGALVLTASAVWAGALVVPVAPSGPPPPPPPPGPAV